MMNLTGKAPRDHGGGLDAAIRQYGGVRSDWIDLSTGINPLPYSVKGLHLQDWTALPDQVAQDTLITAARSFWNVPRGAAILAAPGASALIARIPALAQPGRVRITVPTYNEHAAAFAAQGWAVLAEGPAEARVLVHPNNPDGRLWAASYADAALTVIDESFCDVMPEQSLTHLTTRPGTIILKSFGKFWGLAGVRLGFAIARPEIIDQLAAFLGPWPVSGPALRIGAAALSDPVWADATRARLRVDSLRLDEMMATRAVRCIGGTDLFRLYDVADAAAWQARLAQHRIWTRIFPYSDRFLRIGLPPEHGWARLAAVL